MLFGASDLSRSSLREMNGTTVTQVTLVVAVECAEWFVVSERVIAYLTPPFQVIEVRSHPMFSLPKHKREKKKDSFFPRVRLLICHDSRPQNASYAIPPVKDSQDGTDDLADSLPLAMTEGWDEKR